MRIATFKVKFAQGRTPLIYATISGRDNIVQYLLANGAAVNKTNNVCLVRDLLPSH